MVTLTPTTYVPSMFGIVWSFFFLVWVARERSMFERHPNLLSQSMSPIRRKLPQYEKFRNCCPTNNNFSRYTIYMPPAMLMVTLVQLQLLLHLISVFGVFLRQSEQTLTTIMTICSDNSTRIRSVNKNKQLVLLQQQQQDYSIGGQQQKHKRQNSCQPKANVVR